MPSSDAAARDLPVASRTPTAASRRSFLRLAFAGVGVAATGPVLSRTGLVGAEAGAVEQALVPGVISASAPMKGPNVPKFQRELLVPPVIQPTETVTETVLGRPAQVDYYDLVQKIGSTDLLPAPFPKSTIWGYNGVYPGPTFRQSTGGSYTALRLTNTLPNPTSTHLHSSPTQPAHDGHPDDLTYAKGKVPAGAVSKFDGARPYEGTRLYRYPNSVEARTMWYHDHAMHLTAENVYKGLVGFFIQDPDAERTAKFGLDKLPSGKYDVPLLVADMQFTTNGTVAYDDKGDDSLWGNVILVNGRAWPKMTVDRTRYRLRVLVADLSRGYSFEMSRGDQGSAAPTVTIIGTEAGLLADPVVVREWRQGMAERYEIVADFSHAKPGERFTLLNRADDGDMGKVLQFVAAGPVVPSQPVPTRLNDYVFGAEEAQAVNAANPRVFVFDRSNGMWTINGLAWDGRIAAAPKVGTVEKWVLQNKSGGWFHPIHIHLVDFQVVRRNGAAPYAYERGWKDVVYVGPNETVEVVMRFHAAEPIDPTKPTTGKYVMHCHNLVHEDHDMMTQFSTQPGDAGTATSASASAHAHAEPASGASMPSMMVQWELEA